MAEGCVMGQVVVPEGGVLTDEGTGQATAQGAGGQGASQPAAHHTSPLLQPPQPVQPLPPPPHITLSRAASTHVPTSPHFAAAESAHMHQAPREAPWPDGGGTVAREGKQGLASPGDHAGSEALASMVHRTVASSAKGNAQSGNVLADASAAAQAAEGSGGQQGDVQLQEQQEIQGLPTAHDGGAGAHAADADGGALGAACRGGSSSGASYSDPWHMLAQEPGCLPLRSGAGILPAAHSVGGAALSSGTQGCPAEADRGEAACPQGSPFLISDRNAGAARLPELRLDQEVREVIGEGDREGGKGQERVAGCASAHGVGSGIGDAAAADGMGGGGRGRGDGSRGIEATLASGRAEIFTFNAQQAGPATGPRLDPPRPRSGPTPPKHVGGAGARGERARSRSLSRNVSCHPPRGNPLGAQGFHLHYADLHHPRLQVPPLWPPDTPTTSCTLSRACVQAVSFCPRQ